MPVKLLPVKEAIEQAKARMGGIDKTIDQIKEDVDSVIAGKGRPSERSQLRDIEFVVRGIMNIEESYSGARQICRFSEGSLICDEEISEIRDKAIKEISEILLTPLR